MNTQITDAGCATLVEALDSGALPTLERLNLDRVPASAAAKEAVQAALARSRALTPKPRRWVVDYLKAQDLAAARGASWALFR